MSKYVHKPLYRLGNALAEVVKEQGNLPTNPQTPPPIPSIPTDTGDEANGPRPNEGLFDDLPSPFEGELGMPVADAATVPNYDPQTFPDAANYGTPTGASNDPKLSTTTPNTASNPDAANYGTIPASNDPKLETYTPAHSANPDEDNYNYPDVETSSPTERYPSVSTGGTVPPPIQVNQPRPTNASTNAQNAASSLPMNFNYLSEREEVQEAVDTRWNTSKNWWLSFWISIVWISAIAALLIYAYLNPSYLSLSLLIAGTGILSFFGTLYSTNLLSNSSDLDRGEYRKAITTSFIVLYFILIASRFAMGPEAMNLKVEIGTLTEHFTYLVGMIVGFYFTSSIVRDWRKTDPDVTDVPYTEGEGG